MARLAGAILVLAGLTIGCHHAPTVTTRAEGRLGTIRLVTPARPSAGTVFLFSDASGWTAALDDAAGRLAARGAVVVGVDLPQYLDNLRRSADGCHYVVAELEDLSHRLERETGFEAYRAPVLVGVGEGGTLAYAALAQAPAATVEGAAAVDPAPALATRVPLCSGAHATPDPHGFRYAADAALPAPWRTAAPRGVSSADRTPSADEPTVRPDVADALVAVAAPMLATARPADAITAAVPGMPVVVLPAATPAPLAAIIYSGDGGWRDLDKTIGETLAKRGVPVIGVDSLRYFWHAKSPEQVASDLAAVMTAARVAWGDPSFVLVGYSFGAGILPFAVNRLPADARARVVEVALLGVEAHAPFEIEVTGILGRAPSATAPLVTPEVQRLDPRLLQCFYGDEEPATLCRDPALAAVELVHTKGGHHFDGDYVALADRILAGARRRLAARGTPSPAGVASPPARVASPTPLSG